MEDPAEELRGGTRPTRVGPARAGGRGTRLSTCLAGLLLLAPTQAPRAYLGVALAAAPGPDRAGRVVDVVPGSAAEAHGIRAGDLLLSVDGLPFEPNEAPGDALRRRLRGRSPGDVVQLLVLPGPRHRATRDGRTVSELELASLLGNLDGLAPGTHIAIRTLERQPARPLEVVLGPHPSDRGRRRPALPVLRTHPSLLGPAGDLERVGRRLVAERGGATEVADLRARLAALHTRDDGYRLDELGFVHRHPWRIPEASETLLRALAAPGSEARLDARLRAAAKRDRLELPPEQPVDLPRGVSAEAHADALEALLRRTAEQVAQAFRALSAAEREALERETTALTAALATSPLLHAEPDALRRRHSLALLARVDRVDRAPLYAAALAWSRLADPAYLSALARDLAREPRADEAFILRRPTPLGEIVFAGRGPNRFQELEPAVLVDLGGDDVYGNHAGAATGESRPVAVLIDLAGDDAYESTAPVSQGSGRFGVGLLVDRSGNDRYRGIGSVQGSGTLGIGMLVDEAGNDDYRASRLAQGSGLWGTGLLLDADGDDRYALAAYGQGLGLPGGFGVLHDAAGDDRYFAKGGPATAYGTPGVFDAWAQGTGLGFRGLQSGGIGVLADDGGDDDYEAGSFAQGGGYYFGWGLLHDRGRGDDRYAGSRYNLGYAAHQAAGSFLEDGGDDRYVTRGAAAAGLAWDESVALFRERGGDDRYTLGGFSLGAAAHNGFAVFLEESGSDHYQRGEPGRVAGNDYHGGASLALFLELGPGRNVYPEPPASSQGGGTHGLVLDSRKRLEALAAVQAAPAR